MMFRVFCCLVTLLWSLTPLAAAVIPPEETVDESIKVESVDGVILKGLKILPAKVDGPLPVVLLLHSFGSDRDGLLDLGDALARAGLAAVAMDLRGHGSSIGTEEFKRYSYAVLPPRFLTKAVRDQRELLLELAKDTRLDLARVGVVGVAEGGQVAGALAARSTEVRALVVVDPVPATSGFSPSSDLSIYGRRPALFVCSAVPRSRIQAEALTEYGDGERTVHCVDSYETTDNLLAADSPGLKLVLGWMSEKLVGSPE